MGFAPPPRDGFALLAAHTPGCACMPTSSPMGEQSAMIFRAQAAFSEPYLCVLGANCAQRTWLPSCCANFREFLFHALG
jgi:hypothetical protein